MRESRNYSTKRLFDLSLAAAAVLLSAPLCAVIAAAIKLEDGGSIFYEQERVGKSGKQFRIWKFRSIKSNCCRRRLLRHAECGDLPVTSTGRFLRATGMDELPQLWNIIRGDMSFVGPRPLLPEEAEVGHPNKIVPLKNIPGYEARHGVRPGLTGLAQTFGSRYLTRRQKFRLDLLYIRRQSILLDLQLIAVSLWMAARGKCGDSPNRRAAGVMYKQHGDNFAIAANYREAADSPGVYLKAS
jgi:lipopolysaccharide/colanic/teichoic acid biosynthesis glycosyltransferase